MTTDGIYFVQTPNPATPWTSHPDKATAERAALGMHPTQAVAWFCTGVELADDATSAAVSVPVSEHSGGVVSGVIRKLLGPQIETNEGAA